MRALLLSPVQRELHDRLWLPLGADLSRLPSIDVATERERRLIERGVGGAMADIKTAWGTSTAFTITLNSLASSGTAGRESTVVDNSSNKMLDALVDVNIAFPNSAAANEKNVYIYAYGSADGTNYPESITGSDAAYTFQGAAGALLTALRLIGTVPMNTNTTAGKKYGPWCVAPAFGGAMPRKWGIAVLNYCGQTLHSANNSAQYTEVYATVA